MKDYIGENGHCCLYLDNRSVVRLLLAKRANRRPRSTVQRYLCLCCAARRPRAAEIREGRPRGRSRSISGSPFRFGPSFLLLATGLVLAILSVSPLFLCEFTGEYRFFWKAPFARNPAPATGRSATRKQTNYASWETIPSTRPITKYSLRLVRVCSLRFALFTLHSSLSAFREKERGIRSN